MKVPQAIGWLVIGTAGLTSASTSCSSDADCAAGLAYCASGECLALTSCKLDVDCLNPSNALSACEGGHFTCQNEQCICDSTSECPDGKDSNPCFAAPCSNEKTKCDDAVSCTDNYCDGCNAIRFNEAGYQICNVEDTDMSRATCTTDNDCEYEEDGFQQYCAQGLCLGLGACQSELDCWNPQNNFPRIECVGYMQCYLGMCQVICSDSMCKDADSFADDCSTNPRCEVERCTDSVNCVDDYCSGQCEAIHFDAAGHRTCTTLAPVDIEGQDNVVCQSDNDCSTLDEAGYCAQGECLEMGECHADVDCINPSNSQENRCEGGHFVCESSECRCVAEELCPGGDHPVECFAPPCDVQDCDQAVSCVENYCGGCHAIQFDLAGNHICMAEDTPCTTNEDCSSVVEPARSSMEGEFCSTEGICLDSGYCRDVRDCHNPSNVYEIDDCLGEVVCNDEGRCLMDCFEACSSSDDCASGKYCAAGICLEGGECQVDVDCINPHNAFGVIECEGYLQCTEGMCEKVCDVQRCCFSVPCDADRLALCPEAAECVQDNCDGNCGAIAFDSEGTRVCIELGTYYKGEEDPGDGMICTKDADCGVTSPTKRSSLSGEYCAQGICLPTGQCQDDDDCRNPANDFIQVDCIGVERCGLDGMCEFECGCPAGSEPEECPGSPCELADCFDAASCSKRDCDCTDARFFDPAGFVVCKEGGCTSSEDCGEGSYCSGGQCLSNGQCTTDVDCENPKNVFAEDGCLGYLECDGGQCTKVCSEGGSGRCCFSACEEEASSGCPDAVDCVTDKCDDDCGKIYYSASGAQLCTAEANYAKPGSSGPANYTTRTLWSTICLAAIWMYV